MGSVVVVLQCSCPELCGILVPQLSPLHWKVDSKPLDNQGSPLTIILKSDPEVGLSRRSLWGIPWMVVTMLSNTRSKKVKRTHVVSMPCLEPHGWGGGTPCVCWVILPLLCPKDPYNDDSNDSHWCWALAGHQHCLNSFLYANIWSIHQSQESGTTTFPTSRTGKQRQEKAFSTTVDPQQEGWAGFCVDSKEGRDAYANFRVDPL